MISNTSRTIKYLKDNGWEVDKVEKWIKNPQHPASGFRKDMFGFGDLIAMGNNSIMAVQSCGQSFSEHNRKITEDVEVASKAKLWLENGGRLMLIGWRKVKVKRGAKAMIWKPRIKEYSKDDFVK